MSVRLVLPFFRKQLVFDSLLLQSRRYLLPCHKCRNLRLFSSQSEKGIEIAKSENSSSVSSTVHTVKENTKTASYAGIILLGVGVTSVLFYTVFRELFSNKSPNSVYAKALDKCIADYRVIGNLGEPIKGYGEETRRGRRRHVSHLLYEKDGVNYMRMKFYVQGSRKKATVHLEMKEGASGNYDYRYLFVQLEDYPHTTIILEDNRVEGVQPMQLLPTDTMLTN